MSVSILWWKSVARQYITLEEVFRHTVSGDFHFLKCFFNSSCCSFSTLCCRFIKGQLLLIIWSSLIKGIAYNRQIASSFVLAMMDYSCLYIAFILFLVLPAKCAIFFLCGVFVLFKLINHFVFNPLFYKKQNT